MGNLGQVTSFVVADLGARDHSQGFTTGSNADAYELSGVKVQFRAVPGASATITAFIADGRGTSDSIIANLTNPGTWTATSTFTAPDGITLEASTTYHLIIEGTAGIIATTSASAEDSGGASGWSIADIRYRRNMVSDSGLGGTWNSATQALKIAVEGDHKGTVTECSAASMENRVWTANLTAGEGSGIGTGGFGAGFGTLSDRTISYKGTDYTITGIFENNTNLTFEVTATGGFGIAAANLTLHVGSNQYALDDATVLAGNHYTWTSNVPTWSQYDRVCVALTEVDGTAPALAFAQVASDAAVQIRFDEALDSTSVADKSAFTATVERTSRTVDSVSLSPDGTRITLVVIPAIRPGETINAVGYTVPGTNPLKDAAGNEVGTFTVRNIPNNLAATAPDAPGDLTATPGSASGTMVLTWTTPWANGDAITKFQVRYVAGSSAGGIWTDIDGSGPSTTTHTVTELTAGTEYTFEVHAVNDINDGAAATVTQTTATPAWELTISDSNGNAVTELVEGGASATVTVRITNACDVLDRADGDAGMGWPCAGRDEPDPGRRGGERHHDPPGQSSGTLVISAPDPGGVAAHDPPHTAPLRAMHGENPLGSIDLTLRDDEAPPVATLTAEASQVSEGGTIDVEIRLNPPFGASATSTIGLAVTDADGALVGPLPSEAVFDSGELTHAFTLTAADNAVQNDDAREVTVALVVNPDASPYTLGAPSSVTVTVRDNDTPPSAPRSLTAEAGDGEVRLRWTAPATDNGQAVTGYGYRQREGAGSFGAWTDITGSNVNTTEYTVKSLTNGIVHTFEVRAENPAGWSAESSQASRTPGVADTTAPVLLSATTTALALELTHDEDLDPDSEPDASAFTVTVDGAPRAVTGVSVADAKVLLTLASAVRPGDTVTVSYTKPGANPLKDGSDNEAESFTDFVVTNDLVPTAPEAPGNLTATAGTADTMALAWETPWHNGDDITKFQARYTPGSNPGGTWADIDGSNATTTTHTVTELTAGREYTFEVRAVNGEGYGAEATVTRTTATPAWELTLTDSSRNAVTELVEGGASATVTVRITDGVTFSTAQMVTLEWDGLSLDTINRIRGAGGVSAITIPPGQPSGTLVISAPDPGGVATYDPPHTAPLRAMHGENRLGSIDLTFRDDEAPPVATLTATPSQVSEGGTIDVEIRLNPPFGASATSTIGLAVTDAQGALVGPLPGEAVFDSGELMHAFALTVDDNAVQNDDAREVTVALVANPDASPYTLGAPSSVTVTVRDNDTPPSAPRDLTAEPGDGQVRLRWTAPLTDNGQAMIGYGYRQKEGTGSFGAWTDITGSDVNTTEHTVGGLTNAIVHTFEVRAENPAGWSAESNQASRTPGVADTTAPVLLSATTTALALELTYDEDLDPGSEPAPSAFTVTVDGAPRAVIGVSLDGAKVLLTLASAVRPGETVTVSYTVSAMNPLRDEASNPAAGFTDEPVTNSIPATAPDAPTDLDATPGDGSVTLRWTAPAHHGGREVTGYQYRQKTTGGFGTWEDIEESAPGEANAASFVVTSLMNGTSYTFEVQARNEEGESGPSNQAHATPVAADTTAPMLQGATTTALALGLTYDEDLDPGSEPAPSAFTVTVDGASRAVTGVALDETKARLTLASAVRAGETVTVSYTVPAMNPLRDEAGNPAAGFTDHAVTNLVPATAPDAPASLDATPGDGSVTLRWTAPAHDGGRAITGHQYCREEGPSASCTAESDWRDIVDSAPGGANATGYTVTRLTNGTGYTFRVRAVNAEGVSAASNEAGTTPQAADTIASPEVVRALSAGFGRMVGSQALRMVSAHLEGGGGPQVTVGGERLGGSATAALARLAAAARHGDGGRPRTRSGREALLGSSFRLESGGKEGGAAAWGRIAAGRFETRSDGVATEGEVTTGMVGGDVTSGRWLAGGALSHARGQGSFASAGEGAEGEAKTRLTAVHPYARVRLGERLSAWGLAGYGKGELTLAAAGGERVETGLRLRMGAVGARGTVVPAPVGGGYELALKADALWMRVSTQAAEGLPGTRADARRVRLVLDAARVVETAGGATLTPRFEAGVRRDGGDTQRGAGLEVGAGLRYARSAVTVEGRVRALALHEASGYEEWGASGSVRVDPSASGRGLSLTLAPAWGDAASAVERLWSLRDAGGLAVNADFEPRARLDAELGYGLKGPRGVGVATLYAGLGLAGEGERAWRAGARWDLAPGFTLGLEATRHEPSIDDPPAHRLLLRGALRW